MVNKKTIIIAEAGVNHNGNISLALKLVDCAINAGADIIKFQTFNANNLILKHTPKTKYQIKNTNSDTSQYQMLKTLELSKSEHARIKKYCDKKNIEFLSTAFSLEELDYLVKLGIKRIKIPSGEITNLPYLEKAASFKLPIILSTGMSTFKEVQKAYQVLVNSGANFQALTILHCTSNYPAKIETVNLRAMNLFKEKFNVKVGYSDHTIGNETALAAVSIGAEIIEKHLTLDNAMEGPDHKASINPLEFKILVQSIRKIELILGQSLKQPNHIEIENSMLVRKSIVSSCKISKGEEFTLNNLTTKRPGTGLSPMMWYKVIGTKSKKNYMKDELIDYDN